MGKLGKSSAGPGAFGDIDGLLEPRNGGRPLANHAEDPKDDLAEQRMVRNPAHSGSQQSEPPASFPKQFLDEEHVVSDPVLFA